MKIHLAKLIVILLASFTVSNAQKVSFTFNVDMNPTGLKVGDTVLNVGIRGSAYPLTWVNGIKLTDKNNDGIYSAKVDFDSDEHSEIYFKYVLNEVEWEGGEARNIQVSENIKFHNSEFKYVERPENPFKKFIGE
ncbi:MAG: hypothetical protein AAF363_16940 [Bacteroidota bacterium]